MIAKPPPTSATPGVDETALAEAHRRLLADSSIQFDLPAVEPPRTPDWMRAIAAFIESILPALEILFWIALALLALYILYGIAMWLMGKEWPRWRRRSKHDAAAGEDWRLEAAPARALLQDADALAAKGLYSEAAHMILFRSIEDIEGRRPSLLGPALTSRDIAALPAIPDRPRGAFARIAMLVERSLFAARPLAEADWRDCRAAYEEFAFVEGWRR